MKFWKRALCLGLGALLAASALPVTAGGSAFGGGPDGAQRCADGGVYRKGVV